MDRVKRCALRFWLANEGNISITAALMMVPVIGMAGGAVDYSFAYAAKMNLERAADAAVIAGVADAKARANTVKNDELKALVAQSVKQVFQGALSAKIDVGDIDFDVSSDLKGGVLTASVNFTYTQNTMFLGVLGMNSIGLSGGATAKSSIGSYTDFNILVDVSNSMGVGASQSDIDYLNKNNIAHGKACAFACHSDIDRIRKMPVKVRIDVASEAINLALKTVDEQKHPDSIVRFGLYRFALRFEEIFNASHPSSSDTSWVRNMVTQNVQLTKDNGTRAAMAKGELAKRLAPSGDGSLQNDPKRYALIITDGVQWVDDHWSDYDPKKPFAQWSSDRRGQTPHGTACDALKDKGITVYVLYTTYIPIYNKSSTDALADRIKANVLPYNQAELRACASSPDKFYEATETTEIKAAMEEIFYRVAVPTHIAG